MLLIFYSFVELDAIFNMESDCITVYFSIGDKRNNDKYAYQMADIC